jgi:hypothetical protein
MQGGALGLMVHTTGERVKGWAREVGWCFHGLVRAAGGKEQTHCNGSHLQGALFSDVTREEKF